MNLSAAREIEIPWLSKITDRVVLLNIFDRTNLIRPERYRSLPVSLRAQDHRP